MTSWNQKSMDRLTGPTWINVLLGLWLIASPWVYGVFGGGVPAAWNSIIVGVLIALVAAARLGSEQASGEPLSWINVVLGAWMIASPFIYGYAQAGPFTANSIVVGVIVLFLALVATPAEPAYESGWRSGAPWWGYSPYSPWGFPAAPYGWEPRESSTDFRGRGPRGFHRSDERLRDAICERMADSPLLDASDIDVSVAGGTVTLHGIVASRSAKRLAEQLADSIAGVRDVQNELRIGGAATRDTARRIA
jgi:BON domain/SPW repeat